MGIVEDVQVGSRVALVADGREGWVEGGSPSGRILLVLWDDKVREYLPAQACRLVAGVTRPGSLPPRAPGPAVFNSRIGRASKWSQDGVVRAIQRWAAQHGAPPRGTDWMRAGQEWPSRGTVVHLFGSWASAVEAAGFPRPRPGRPGDRNGASRGLA